MSEITIHERTAQRRVHEFQHKHGRNALHLAYHAALSVALNTEILHLLRINFFLDTTHFLPYTAEADLLLSPLCQEIGDDLYEIESDVRNELLRGLALEYGYNRIREVSVMLWQYNERRMPWENQVSLERAQQLTILNFLDSKKAKQWLDKAKNSSEPSMEGMREWFVAMHKELQRQKVLESSPLQVEPTMNLIAEIAAFENIVSGQDSQTRLILVSGESGIGKSHLLKLYRQITEINRLDHLDFSMGWQITIEEDCLYQIVVHFGLEHFPAFDELWSAGPPEPLPRPKERQWQRALTHKLFTDLRSYHQAPRLAIFFDQFEKADLAFKSWLIQDFLPHISAQNPIIVVIAGQEEITLSLSTKSFRHFHLNGVTVDWYHDYVKQCQAPIDSTQINLLHTILQGRPKLFVEYVRSQLQAGGKV